MVVAGCGWFWVVVAGFGWLWLVVGGFGSFLVLVCTIVFDPKMSVMIVFFMSAVRWGIDVNFRVMSSSRCFLQNRLVEIWKCLAVPFTRALSQSLPTKRMDLRLSF